MLKCASVAGKFSPEFPHTSSFICVPSDFLSLREKVYHLQVKYRVDPDSPMITGAKLATRCGVKKARMSKYSLEDFKRMTQAQKAVYVHSLVSFRSKLFQIFKISVSRSEPTVFSRKQFILSSGKSFPHGYYKNASLNAEDDFSLDVNE